MSGVTPRRISWNPTAALAFLALFRVAGFPQTADVSLQQAMALVQQGQAAPAIDLLEKILAGSPKDLKALNLLGIAQAGSGQRVEASRSFGKALEVDPRFVPALKNLAANELALGHRENARTQFEAAAKLAPSDPIVSLALAEIAYDERRFTDAAAAAERIGRSADGKTQFAAGLLLTRLEKYEAAAQRFEWAEATYPDRYNAGYNAALALFRAGKFEDAIRVGTHLAPDDPRRAELLNLMAQAQEKAGRTKDAYESLRQATKISPDDETNYLDLIALCLEHQNYDLSIEIADIGLKLIPGSHRLRLQRGVVYAVNGRMDIAEKDFALAAELAPPDISLPIVCRGMILMQVDRTGDAVELFRKRIEQHPNDYLVNLYLAEALTKQGAAPGSPEEEQAVAALELAIRLKPEVAQTHLLLGKLLFKRGDLPTAASHLETALQLDPKDNSAAYQLAMLYRRQGNTKRAAELFERVGKANSEELDQTSSRALMRIVREGSR